MFVYIINGYLSNICQYFPRYIIHSEPEQSFDEHLVRETRNISAAIANRRQPSGRLRNPDTKTSLFRPRKCLLSRNEVYNRITFRVPKMSVILEAKKLTKFYGPTRGVENLNLKIEEGEIFGFLGPNGAGKTTTIRLLLHLLRPTSGEALVFGKSVGKKYVEILRDIGYLTSDLNLYEKMTGQEMLDFTASFHGGTPTKKFTDEIIKKLNCNLTTPFKKLSRGNKQKIGILMAIFHKPKLLILDEPTSGLDPLTRNAFYEILFDLKKEGTTIFFSSHDLPEVEKICDRVGIIRGGKLVDVETIDVLRAHRSKIVEIYFAGEYDKKDFSSIKGVKIVESRPDYLHIQAKSLAINDLVLSLSKYKVKDINFAYPDLEKVFLEYYKK